MPLNISILDVIFVQPCLECEETRKTKRQIHTNIDDTNIDYTKIDNTKIDDNIVCTTKAIADRRIRIDKHLDKLVTNRKKHMPDRITPKETEFIKENMQNQETCFYNDGMEKFRDQENNRLLFLHKKK